MKPLLFTTTLLLCLIAAVSASGEPVKSNKAVSVAGMRISPLHFFDTANKVFDRNKVDFDKGWIGIYMENAEDGGVIVKMIVKGAPSDVYGVRSGDVIKAVDGNDLTEIDGSSIVKFKKIIEDAGKDNVVTLKVDRDGREIELGVRLTGKLLTNDRGRSKQVSDGTGHFCIEGLRGRTPVVDGSFFHLVADNDGFNDSCFRTLQRIGEEVMVREGYQNNGDVNVFRLSLIDHLMTNPFDVPDAAGILRDAIAAADVSDAISRSIELLDMDVTVPKVRQEAAQEVSLQEVVESIVDSIYNVADLQGRLPGSLSKKEFDFLYNNAPGVWLNDEGGGTETVGRVLDIAMKTDMSKFIDNLHSVIASVPVKRLGAPGAVNTGMVTYDLANTRMVKPEHNRAGGRHMPITNGAGFAGDVLFVDKTDIGTVVVGGPGTTYYYDDAAVTVDVGGNDFYFNNAGSSRPEAHVSVCIDVAGNDVYSATAPFSQGSGRFGAGILIDLEGDDRYYGMDYSQGFGLFGIGLLHDKAGNDQYNARSMCQGGGAFGVGLLQDGGGDDRYQSWRYSQGVGMTKGVGSLVDLAGNDVYSAGGKYPDFRDPGRSFQSFSQGFGIGIRPDNSIVGASGGIGMLFDRNGNDSYYGDFFGQGSSYYFSMGLLYDENGHDQYHSGRYSQGAGIHSTIGILKDDAGNDLYNAYFGVSQACGYDTAIGYLVDTKGDDYYRSNTMAQGTGGEKGFGLLADFAGNDYYFAGGGGSQGFSHKSANETYYGVGVLGDVGGNADIFSTLSVGGNSLNYRGSAGVLLNKGD